MKVTKGFQINRAAYYWLFTSDSEPEVVTIEDGLVYFVGTDKVHPLKMYYDCRVMGPIKVYPFR